MKSLRYRAITVRSLNETIDQQAPAGPDKGWLLAVREGLGLSRAALAKRLSLSPSAIQAFEQSEARGSISVQSLKKLADALDCQVVVKLVPKRGKSFLELAAQHDPEIVSLSATELALAQEPQATGDFEQWQR